MHTWSWQKIRQDKVRTSLQNGISHLPFPFPLVCHFKYPGTSASKGPTQGRSSLTWMLGRQFVTTNHGRLQPANQLLPFQRPPAPSLAHCSLKPSLLGDTGIPTLTATTDPDFSSIHSSPNKQPKLHIPSPPPTRRTRTLIFYNNPTLINTTDINSPSPSDDQKPPPRSSPHPTSFYHHHDARPRHRDGRFGLPRRRGARAQGLRP